jgi:TRAP-type C4-dicarboxylate transport system substrate-binding protein
MKRTSPNLRSSNGPLRVPAPESLSAGARASGLLSRRRFLAFCSACALLPVRGLEAAEGRIHLRIATIAIKGTSFHKMAQAMGEKWRKISNGRVRLTIYTDGTMGGEVDVVRRMRIGQLQGGMLTSVGLGSIDPAVTALQYLPMMFKTWDEVDFVREQLRPKWEKAFLEKGFVILFWGDAGWVRFFSKKPILVPEDLKSMKVFATAGENESYEMMKPYYQPVPLDTKDILPSLETGLINAVPMIPIMANAGQFYGPAPHMLNLNWVPAVGATVVVRSAWEKIPAAIRQPMLEAALSAGEEMRKRARQENDEAVAAMQKRGLKVHPLTPEAEGAWKRVAEEVYPEIRGKLVPAETFDEVIRLVNEYRSSRKAPTA